MAKLTYVDSRGRVHEVTLGHQATVGRHPDQDLQVLDRVVSKQHSIVEKDATGRYFVRDAGSRNGTFVNGKLVETRSELRNGDRITIGSSEIVFSEEMKTDPLAGRVTIMAGNMDTHIRGRVASRDEGRFLPEGNVEDERHLRQDYEKLRISYELNQAIGLEMDLEVLLDKILDKAFEIFPADRGVILLKEAESATLVPMVVKARGGEANIENVRISQTILSEIMEEKQGLLSSDAMMDSRFAGSHSIILEQIRSTMTVPLMHDDEVLGVIHLDSKIASGAFMEKDLQVLSGFARQAALMIRHQRLLTEFESQVVMREKLHRLLSPQLVEEVVSGRLDIKKGGELRRATVMFADIRGFTTISERMPPQEVVNLLNEYFELMVDIIFKYEGTLDKFVGDEIMAVWGAPITRPDDTERAVRAAVEMQQAMRRFNEAQDLSGNVGFEIGIGLNTGEVVAGYMGSTKSMNYTVMGDTVNTAARFCSTAGPQDVLIGENTFREVGFLFDLEKLPPTKLKGKLEHVDIYRVLNLKPVGDDTETHQSPRNW
ncbi:FHA domain-containing protein [Microvenator marinus]|uniref:FHA domain-containing protein n=1 Tax=Microvenator marinus TaxID=2600177 RepID=A0A5B8XVA7_9DELT|nr:adenylate/guanylate cyclase domain-containing protein [Microvenator marinus]QED29515.1 FHA domain-containing protein [Microvenator marinus]